MIKPVKTALLQESTCNLHPHRHFAPISRARKPARVAQAISTK
jgi:hypothetical protein